MRASGSGVWVGRMEAEAERAWTSWAITVWKLRSEGRGKEARPRGAGKGVRMMSVFIIFTSYSAMLGAAIRNHVRACTGLRRRVINRRLRRFRRLRRNTAGYEGTGDCIRVLWEVIHRAGTNLGEVEGVEA